MRFLRWNDTLKSYKTNGILFQGYFRKVLFFILILFLKHLHQVAFSVTLKLYFIFVDAQKFSNIILVYNVLHQW